jgi:hypothetical protein
MLLLNDEVQSIKEEEIRKQGSNNGVDAPKGLNPEELQD